MTRTLSALGSVSTFRSVRTGRFYCRTICVSISSIVIVMINFCLCYSLKTLTSSSFTKSTIESQGGKSMTNWTDDDNDRSVKTTI